MKNRIAIAAALAVLVGGLVYVSDIPDGNQYPIEVARSLDIDQSVTGTGLGSMTGAPAAWTVIALPKDYKTNDISQELLKDFATKESLIELRKNTEVRTMVEGDPLMSQGGPLDAIKWFPTVCVINTQGKLLFKRSGGYCNTVADDVAEEGINDKIAKPLYANDNKLASTDGLDIAHGMDGAGIRKKFCPSCPFKPCQPKTEPVVDRPETPEIPDTPHLPDVPKDDEKDAFIPLAIFIGCVAGVIAYFRQ